MSIKCSLCKQMSSSFTSNLFYTTIFVILVSCLPKASAFGSGNIPDAAYLKGKAWRHGDIEDTLEGLAKVAGESGGAMVGAIASALLGAASGSFGRVSKGGGKKFTGLDVKRIYFGNWLRDLSQVCDIAGFKAMTPESLVICIMTMGFLSFGYATREFQVTRERLSVYLLTEHIDNPKGYAEGEDPRKYDPRLRPPVDEARELRIDERNGMKMYIASDDQGFDTSTACIRRVFRQCIELGRQARQEGNEEKEFESFRLLGTGLHTLEDFSAHSNWCELALQKLGHKDVFAHVGENVKVNSPEGPVPPLVTGTFAGADFCFSMLGEASDKLSSASIADLTAQLDSAQDASKKPGGINLGIIKTILSKLPMGGKDPEVQNDLDSMDQKKHAFDLDGRIDQIAPAELQAKIWDLFRVRDNLMRRIEELIQGIPGLGEILDNLSLSLAQWVMVTIDPFVRPILLQASSAIGQGSHAVISGNDQWTVFNDPNASDPTHSVLAKDHFSNILNDPAGNVSIIIVKYTVGLMVEAWSNTENPDRVIDRILEAIHHPNYANRNSKIQRDMLEYMQKWLSEMDRDERELTIKSLTKDSVRNHRNQRKTSKGGVDPRISGGAPSHGHSHPAYQQASKLGGPQSQNQSNDQGKYSSAGSHSQSQYGGTGFQSQGRQANQYGRTSAEPQNKYDQNYGNAGSQSQAQYGSQHGNTGFQSEGHYGSQYGRTSAEPQNKYDQNYGNAGSQSQAQYGSQHGNIGFQSEGHYGSQYGRTSAETQNKYGSTGGSQSGGQYGSQYGATNAQSQDKYDDKYGSTGSQSGGQYGSQYVGTNVETQSKYVGKYGSIGSQSGVQYGSQSGRTDAETQNKYGSTSSQSGGQYGSQYGRTNSETQNKYGSTGNQSEGQYGNQCGGTNAESQNKYNDKHGSKNSHSQGQYDDQYGRTNDQPKNKYGQQAYGISGEQTGTYSSISGRDDQFSSHSGFKHENTAHSYSNVSSAQLGSSPVRKNVETNYRTNDYDDTPSFPRPQHEPSYDGRNDFNSDRRVKDGRHDGYDSNPAFPRAHHVSGEADYGLGHQSTGNAYHPGGGSQRYQDYDSTPSFPQASHNSREDSYRSSNDYSHQTHRDSYGGGNNPTHSNNATSYGNTSYDERYGQSSQRAPSDRRSHSRERRHDDRESHDKGSKKDGNRHRRSASKNSNSSGDSQGSSRKSKHDKHKKKHEHDKRKKSKSPDDKHRGHQTTYQGDQYNRSFGGNNQTDSDYGMNRLNVYDKY